jgi:hypothetical protein
MRNKKWVQLLAYATGSVNQELLPQNEYLAAENLILRAKLPARLRLSDPERATLAQVGKRLGRKALREVACIAKPDTIPAWYRRPIAVGNILRRHGIALAPMRSRTTSWRDFIAAHMSVMAGADFFTVEVLAWRG